MNIGPSSPGVCSLTSKFDGEAHKITITWTGPTDPAGVTPINLEASSDGFLWQVGSYSATPTTIVLRAVTYAIDDCSATFTVKKKKPATNGGGGGSANDEGKGYANQIQIHAYAPSAGAVIPFSRLPRPAAQDADKIYYGFLVPYAAKQPTSLDLVFNSKNKGIGKNTITLNLPPGVEAPGFQTGDNNFDGSAFGLRKNLAVRLKDKITTPQTVRLKLENENGSINSSAEDSVVLLPVEVRDGGRVLTSLPFNEDPWTNTDLQLQVPDSTIAWITGNTGFADAPEMPKLKVRILGGSTSLNVRWRFECEYKRGNGYRKPYVADFTRLEDKVGIPVRDGQEYTDEMPASQEWKIYEHSKWTKELNERGFFGGLAKVFLKLENQDEIEVCRFRIGGQNPNQDVAKKYITDHAKATFWYAYAIAKHETFGRVPGRFYNQFYTDHQPVGGHIGDNANDMGWVAWAKAWPLYNLDRSYKRAKGYKQNGPGGYGMFQVTLGPKSPDGAETSEGFIARKEIWNWQENCNRAIRELKGKLPAAQGLQNGLTNTYSKWGTLPARGRLSGLDAITVTYYNGTAGLPLVKISGKDRRSPWSPVSKRQGKKTTRFWQFHENVNDYCQHINQHIE